MFPIPSSWETLTTSSISLYDSGISSAMPFHEAPFTSIPFKFLEGNTVLILVFNEFEIVIFDIIGIIKINIINKIIILFKILFVL